MSSVFSSHEFQNTRTTLRDVDSFSDRRSSRDAGGARSTPIAALAASAVTDIRQRLEKKLAANPQVVSEAQVKAFARLVVESRESVIDGYVMQFIRRGVSVQQVYMHLFTPAAQLLGKQWTSDEIDFSRLSLAFWRLQKSLFMLEEECPSKAMLSSAEVPNIYLAPMPGSQHTFGVHMLADMARRQGWILHGGPSQDEPTILAEIARNHFEVIGLSLSSEKHREALPSLVSRIRQISLNPRVAIIVGGSLASDLIALGSVDVGGAHVDYVASDALDAIAWMSNYIKQLATNTGESIELNAQATY